MMRVQFRAPEVHDVSGRLAWAQYAIEGDDNEWRVRREGELVQHWPREEFRLLHVLACGVCSTDFALHRFPFPLPTVGGHEIVASDGTERFCIEINCGHHARGAPAAGCPFCSGGVMPSQCPQRRTVGIDTLLGGFAPVILVPRESVCRVPAGMPTRLAALAEPFAAALHAVRSVAAIPLDAAVCVLGPKKLGFMIVLALHCARHSNVTAIGRSAAALQLCRELGAKPDGNDGATDLYDVVFDCTGSPSGFDTATALVKPGGIVHVKSTGGKPVGAVTRMTALVVDEIAILSGAGRPPEQPWEWRWQQHNAWDAHDQLVFDGVGDGRSHTVVVVPSFGDVDRVHAAKLVRPRGAIVVTAAAATADGDLCWNRVATKRLQVHTSRCGSIPDALAELDRCDERVKRLLQDRYITHVFPLERFEDAFVCARDSPDALKVLVVPTP